MGPMEGMDGGGPGGRGAAQDGVLMRLAAARSHWAAGRPAETLEACEGLAEALAAREDWAGACEASWLRGEALRRGRRSLEAIQAFLVAHGQALRAGNPMWRLRTRGGLCFTIRDLDRQDLRPAQRDLLRAYRQGAGAEPMVQALLVLAQALRRWDLTAEGEALLAELGSGDALAPATRGGLLREQGWLRLRQGRLAEAGEAFAAAHRCAAQDGNPFGQLEGLRGLATVAVRRGEAWAAHGLLLEAERCLALLPPEPRRLLVSPSSEAQRAWIQDLRGQVRALRGRGGPPAAFAGLRGRCGAA